MNGLKTGILLIDILLGDRGINGLKKRPFSDISIAGDWGIKAYRNSDSCSRKRKLREITHISMICNGRSCSGIQDLIEPQRGFCEDAMAFVLPFSVNSDDFIGIVQG
jgi:hypothetical protein